jgi:hypothetical protein
MIGRDSAVAARYNLYEVPENSREKALLFGTCIATRHSLGLAHQARFVSYLLRCGKYLTDRNTGLVTSFKNSIRARVYQSAVYRSVVDTRLRRPVIKSCLNKSGLFVL